MGLFNKFTDTEFYKSDSELEQQLEALKKLNSEYPGNEQIEQKLKICEMGLFDESSKAYDWKCGKCNNGEYWLPNDKKVLNGFNFSQNKEKIKIYFQLHEGDFEGIPEIARVNWISYNKKHFAFSEELRKDIFATQIVSKNGSISNKANFNSILDLKDTVVFENGGYTCIKENGKK